MLKHTLGSAGGRKQSLQLVKAKSDARRTTILDDVRMHGRSLCTVSRERGLTANEAALAMVDQAEEEIDAAYRLGFKTGQRSMLCGFRKQVAA